MMCQCPERGDLHFYKTGITGSGCAAWCVNALKGATSISTKESLMVLKTRDDCVNALKGATSISTANQKQTSAHPQMCVNALKGATSISTLASGNPHK